MSEKVLKNLYDTRLTIEEIDSNFIGKEKRCALFKQNLQLKRAATERNLEIIGEAMSLPLKAEEDIVITDLHRIVGFRNQIIQGYDSISDENIWAIVINHFPLVKKEVNNLISTTQ